ncbi:glycoside hydrolase family 38 C-terminal domain-containing protein [Cellulomonas sp. KRMCY2]|uniref:alpha-mannosidase n=1 Tax=Cellulomonas sp. KRMCY2 TaxID=1304865 RepID=UPI00045EB3B5|nr:glycoside hydrolase family 38 C-terminal domain-containing protein [Cellulomonas sp. KRMCY2]
MHHNDQHVTERSHRTLDEQLLPAVHRARARVDVEAWEVPDEPVAFEEAVAAAYRPLAVGDAWGRPWGTTWFHLRARVPEDWRVGKDSLELLVDLGFTDSSPGFQAEALAYRPDGRILKGIEPRNAHVTLPQRPGEPVELYLEAASNPDIAQGGRAFLPTPLGDKETAGDQPLYRLRRLELAIRDVRVWDLVQDVRTLHGLLDVLPRDRPRYATVLRALEQMLDVIDPDDVPGTAEQARDLLAPVLASPANATAHTVVAVGHAHIDSAWLWPVRETVRKCARTFANVLDLMDEDPDFVFACSSAQQYAWVKERYPALFERVRARVAEGRFVPVGGMWVESDTNMPGGEAMVRQFVAGKRFFLEEFGLESQEVWLPDSFGYSAALPQIAVGAGNRWFLTQKMSWNDTNTMPHHTFRWEGIDGTRIFTHFPPVDTYNSELSAVELDRAERQFADKGATNVSLVPFGFGDGGGGPTREMLAAARRAGDLEGLPRVRLGSAQSFFEAAEADYADPPVWSGELYLELHRGTYTSQARTKRGNRRSEHLLREAELWAAAAAVRTGASYPYDELESAWHTVLLQQFHDILPGSSIAWVHREAERRYDELAQRLEPLIDDALSTLVGAGSSPLCANAGPLAVADAPALGVAPALSDGAAPTVTATPEGGATLDNGLLRVVVDRDGLIRSVRHVATGREVVAAGAAAGLLQLHRDTPNKWDAWDIDAAYRRVHEDLTEAQSVAVIDGADGACVEVRRMFGASSVVQRIALRPGSTSVDLTFDIDWHERQKLLKLTFPVAVHADRFAAETQFGHVFRPTHTNTSWEAARFEVCAHRWVHVAEPGFGVGVANDSTYGHDVRRERTGSGDEATVIRLSLLRAPLFPDPEADQGRHALACSLVVGADVMDAVAEGYRLNVPPRAILGAGPSAPLLAVDDPAIVVEAVKLAEDRSGDLVVRLYEARGAARAGTLTTAFEWEAVVATDLLERPQAEVSADGRTGRVEVALRAFEIRTLRFSGARAAGTEERT